MARYESVGELVMIFTKDYKMNLLKLIDFQYDGILALT